MQLGAFSVSLSVKDLTKSIAFYKDLGFSHFGGLVEHNFAIMKSGDTLIGLFQGMFEGNMITFNPGWDQSANEVDPFDDVREIKAKVKAAGHEVSQETGEDSGIGSFVVIDPDGNPILIDQHR
ncbi:VOC family protein [Octadecabacter sp. 1_MG-2023]|uniref:VOC family protein n=1 Tax=unclassified Octadecabacter TaxID=196158 RepID=UPI001C08FC5D|nr:MULTISPECIES: VOC family protein [unclassified Octadecabacter]MBU2992114.1 VOC family protein [Octadecabacter sp. B2R22]MDO6735130.1 VOC family protein [Octadecabacter sp. 1_MG-2023]